MARDMASPPPLRARSLHAAMEKASSSSVKKMLRFSSSDDEDGSDKDRNDEKKEWENCCHDTSGQRPICIQATASKSSFRNRTRRVERMDTHGRQEAPYRRKWCVSPTKLLQQRRSSSEQRTPTSHRRASELARRYSRSVSPPCASPATLLSHSLGSTLSIKSPAKGQRRSQVVLRKLNVIGCMNHFISSFEDVKVVRWLGEGISAEVYEIRDLKSDTLFAVKKSKQALRNVRERDLLAQEINILEKLTSSHHNFDNIVRYYQAWQENDFFFLQMELCEGGTLQDFLTMRNRQLLPERYFWYIVRDVASGLKTLSDHGIIHLDIKPDNIFVTEDGRLKIGDFGMAGNVINSTEKTSNVGFLEGDAKYIAKELLTSAERLPSADIFCLGIMMLEIATGIDLPEGGKMWQDLRKGKLPTISSEYSKDVNEMIQKMMHPDPAKRPSADEILQNSCVRTATKPVALFQERVSKPKLIVSNKLRNNTNRSARRGLHTPHKTRRSLA